MAEHTQQAGLCIGQPYNPFGLFKGASPGAKLSGGRLARYAGRMETVSRSRNLGAGEDAPERVADVFCESRGGWPRFSGIYGAKTYANKLTRFEGELRLGAFPNRAAF
jgi:hypothetical protein